LDCYENAYAKQPENEELGIELFYCFLRLRQSKKQQQFGMKLYKSYTKRKYLFWSVASMFQSEISKPNEYALVAPSSIPMDVYSLAQRILQKVIYEFDDFATPLGAEELQLYVEVRSVLMLVVNVDPPGK